MWGTFTTIVTSPYRLHRAQCAIKQTQVTVQKIGREIEEKLRCTSTSNELVRSDYLKPYPAGLLKHLAGVCWPYACFFNTSSLFKPVNHNGNLSEKCHVIGFRFVLGLIDCVSCFYLYFV